MVMSPCSHHPLPSLFPQHEAPLIAVIARAETAAMLGNGFVAALALAAGVAAFPVESPLQMIKRAPSPGIVITKCAKPGVLALAYDDGPYQYTSQLVDILDKGGAKGTFFWTGTLYGCIYNQAAAVKKAHASGHQIASHTWSHSQSFGNMNQQQLTQEMQRVENALVNLVGVKPAYMRPPYLQTSGQVLPTMRQLNYKVITDDVDSNDWNNWSAQQSQNAFQQAGARGNGHIPLMHETYASTVQTLTPWLINWAKQNNLALVTVAECLDDKDGMYQKGNFTGDGKSSC
jgi:peptidoglycan/xylan/chitin deacetylase (PgdA/CDA1 family)